MATEIIFRFGQTKDKKLHQCMADDFIRAVKHFNALVVEDPRTDTEGWFDAFAPGIRIAAISVPDSLIGVVRDTFKPIRAAKNARRDYAAEDHYAISIDSIDRQDITSLPRRISEFQQRALIFQKTCGECGRHVPLHSKQKYCPFCGQGVAAKPHGDWLMVCLDCPSDGEEENTGRVYPSAFSCCPRCGQQLVAAEDYAQEWEYVFDDSDLFEDLCEAMISGLGVPLDHFDWAEDLRQKVKSNEG
jgi:endogenous inhibitor of DNA gyrase (YacG/DUF329 family)